MKLYELVSSPMTLKEIESTDDIRILDVALQELFGWEVQPNHHIADRLVGREKNVSIDTILSTFSKLRTKYSTQIARVAQMGKQVGEIHALVQDSESHLNILLVFGRKVVLKTIMYKDPEQFKVGNNIKFKFMV